MLAIAVFVVYEKRSLATKSFLRVLKNIWSILDQYIFKIDHPFTIENYINCFTRFYKLMVHNTLLIPTNSQNHLPSKRHSVQLAISPIVKAFEHCYGKFPRAHTFTRVFLLIEKHWRPVFIVLATWHVYHAKQYDTNSRMFKH